MNVGIVYYKDDPACVFRIVFPEKDENELLQNDWTVFGTDPSRQAVMEIVSINDPRVKLTGVP